MIITQYKCDLCGGDITSNELNQKYKAQKLKYKSNINTSKNISIDDIKNKISISAEWKDIDVCEDCFKEIIKRKHKNIW